MPSPIFDPVIHEPNRLRICAFLAPLDEAEFQVLRDALDVTDSALSKHIKQLEKVGHVNQKKNKVNGRQRTWVYITAEGLRAFEGHVAELKRLANVAGKLRDVQS